MQERNFDWLPLIHAPTGTKPAPQARPPARNQTDDLFPLQDDAQPTEPPWSGLGFIFL